jgi:signal peptidase I
MIEPRTDTPATGRSPLVAVVLSLFATGLGHVYSGQIVRGLGLFLLSLLFGPVTALAAFLNPSTVLLVVILGSVLVVLGVYLYAIVDAYRVARRARTHYQLRDYNRPIVYAVFLLIGLPYPAAVFYILRANCFEAYLVPTASEVPNILPGDHILANKVALQGRFPRRGETTVFYHNLPEGQRTWIKRVIALPGDTVAVHNGEVTLNGKKLERDRVSLSTLAGLTPDIQGEVYEEVNGGTRYLTLVGPVQEPIPDFPEQKVPEGHLFVLGDNRNLSRDSREFGFILRADVIGSVQYIYLPAQRWRRFGACAD